jgi:transcriptional regulator with XRE-family HTH domain
MDWKGLIAELAEAGLTQVQVAAECGVAQSTISDLHRGETKSPSFELGQKLVALRARLGAERSAQKAAA